MSDTSMRGFTVAVARAEPTCSTQAACIAVGCEGEGEERRTILTLRHADGTMLTTYLSDASMGRLADLLTAAWSRPAEAYPPCTTLQ